jgi:hypothetical protein
MMSVAVNNSMTGATKREGTPYHSETPKITPRFFIEVRVLQSLVFVECFVNHCLTIVLPFILRFTVSGYHFGILDLRLLITTLVS